MTVCEGGTTGCATTASAGRETSGYGGQLVGLANHDGGYAESSAPQCRPLT